MIRICSALAIVLIASLALAACGGDDESETTTTTTTTATGASGATGTTGEDSASVDDPAADADAKAAARTAQTVIETLAIDEAGSYADLTVDDVTQLDPSLDDAQLELESSRDTYEVTATSESGNTFTVERAADGTPSMVCTEPGVGGCDEKGEW